MTTFTVAYMLLNIRGRLTIKVVLKINALPGQHLAKARRRNTFFNSLRKQHPLNNARIGASEKPDERELSIILSVIHTNYLSQKTATNELTRLPLLMPG